MSVKIQKPSIGRTVHFTPLRTEGEEDTGTPDVYAGIITAVSDDGDEDAVVDICTFGPTSLYFQLGIRHSASGRPGTWRYPPYVSEHVEVRE